MTDDIKRGSRVAEPKNAEPKLVEVSLQRRYVPANLVETDSDGNVVLTRQHNHGVTVTLEPGIYRLEAEDAGRALERGIALPTTNTFKGI